MDDPRFALVEGRTRPDFMLVGGMKCGSTSFARYLSAHPQVVLAGPKEPNYWSWHRYPARYQDFFVNESPLVNPGADQCVSGEFSTSYLVHPLAPRRIRANLPGFDSLLAFDLGTKEYVWGYHLIRQYGQWAGHTFDPRSKQGPVPVNDYHINMVHVDKTGIYFSGQRTNALLRLGNSMEVSVVCSLPADAHNARPYRDGVLWNDTESECVRYAGRDGRNLAFKTASYDEADIEFASKDDLSDVRQGFARGLCAVGDRFVAAGSSPSTISLYDFEGEQRVGSVNLSMDIRNAIHGLASWPFDA